MIDHVDYMIGYLYKKIERHNPVITWFVLTVIIINVEVTTVKGRNYPCSASSIGDRQNSGPDFSFSVDL